MGKNSTKKLVGQPIFKQILNLLPVKNMILQSNNNFYIYCHQTKYVFPLHPVVARFAYEAHVGMENDLREIEKELINNYSKKEIKLLYHQYLFFKEQWFFEGDISKWYGKVGKEWIIENFQPAKQLVFEVTEGCNLQCTPFT
jgi:hypothetical protein